MLRTAGTVIAIALLPWLGYWASPSAPKFPKGSRVINTRAINTRVYVVQEVKPVLTEKGWFYIYVISEPGRDWRTGEADLALAD